MRAFVVVDVQRDFVPGGALPADHGDRVVGILNELMDRFDLIVACKEEHPPDHCSFASVHGKQVGEVIEWDEQEQILWPDHCVAGTQGAEFVPGLNVDRFAQVFIKGKQSEIESYSGFYDNDWRRSTGMAEFLKDRGVDHLFIGGLTTEYCVRNTALDGVKLGFKVAVITDAIHPVELHEGDAKKALDEIESHGVQLVTSQEVGYETTD